MKPIFLTALTCATMLLFTNATWAQEKEKKKEEFESSRNAKFLEKSSFLNKAAPDVEVYDAEGNPFRLADSRGKHTVVVFGCLT